MDVLKRIPVREQDAKERATNFKEVCLGYNKEEAMEEASRCINCKNAQCVKGCPVAIQIPQFIEQVKKAGIPAPPERSFSANVPCGVSSTSSSPFKYWRSNSLFSPT